MKKLLALTPLVIIAACSQPVEICNDDLFFDDKIGGPTTTCEREPSAPLFGQFQGIAQDRSDRRDNFFGRDKPVERVSENPPYEETPKSSGGSGKPPSSGGSGKPRPEPHEPIPYDETPKVPEVPEKPVEPELPQTPKEPGVPAEPEQPDEPVGPEAPEEPEQPSEPESPAEPEQPEEPEYSDGYTRGWTPERKAADIAHREAAGLPTRRVSICRSDRVKNNPERGVPFRCDLVE